MSRLMKKWRTLWRRRELERDLEDELRFHLEMKAEQLADPLEARRRLGNMTALKEAARELWIFANLETWWQDIRYALRMLGKSPAFTLIAIVALALGIGADAAVFTIVKGAFSWNLGLEHIDKVVLVDLSDRTLRQGFGVSYPDFRDLRTQTKSLASLAAYRFASANLSDDRSLPERYWSAEMSANGFAVSEQKAALGREFTANDERPGAPAVVVLTYHVWQDRYAKDPTILGQTIRVNDVPRTVVGVMPPGKRFPEETDLWTPLVPDAAAERRANRSLLGIGRLADGVSLGYAQAELATIADRLAKRYPATNHGLTAVVRPIIEITGVYNTRALFAALWAAVGFVLLIACADVANMLLARGSGRVREISIRLAIGAGRVRILRQLLIESVVLSMAGGLFGWLVAIGGLRWFDSGTRSLTKPVWLNLSLDRTAFIYLAVISVGTGILFGLAPAWRLARVDVHAAMKDGGQGLAGSRRVLSIANALVMLEMALCLVLLAGAGLMIRSTMNMFGAPLGVTTANVLSMRVNLPEAKYRLAADQLAFHRALKTQLDSVAGVETVGITSNLPLGRWLDFSYELEGKLPEPNRAPQLSAIVTNPAYFQVMRVQPRRGRTFTDSDSLAGVPLVMVNESFAKKIWPAENAVGKRLRLLKDQVAQPWLTVVGVLPDILQNSGQPLEHDPLVYLPYAEEARREMFVVAKTRVPPNTLATAFRRTIQKMDPTLPVYDVQSLDGRLAQNRLQAELLGGMFSVFAAIALLLASLGLYAVISHSVSQRTQEIGLRMAMGGTNRDILKLVYLEGMRPLLLGMAFGLPAALGISHLLGVALIGVSPGDPMTFLIVVFVLTGAGILGCSLPARRAMRVDPIVALRYE